MREMNEAPDASATIEEMSEERRTAAGEWDIECEYCGLPVYYRPGICPSCGQTVAAMDQDN